MAELSDEALEKAAVVVNDGVANRMKLRVEVYGPEQW
jgi:hypothetical protein